MPPKKRGRTGAAAKATVPATPRAQTSPHHVPEEDDKEQQVPETQTPGSVTTSRGKAVATSAAASRSKRGDMAAPEVPEIKTNAKGKAKGNAKGKGKAVVEEQMPTSMIEKDVKKHGRPARAKAEEVIEEAAEQLLEPETVEPVKRGRGRPSMSKKAEVTSEPEPEQAPVAAGDAEDEQDAPKQKRGRPAKKAKNESEAEAEDGEERVKEPAKKRGRPAKDKAATVPESDSEPQQKRGRGRPTNAEAAAAPAKPAKVGKKAATADGTPRRSTRQPTQATVPDESTPPASKTKKPAKAAPVKSGRGRGRPAKAAAPEEEDVEAAPAKKRGRPAKTAAPEVDEGDDASVEQTAVVKKGAGRGRKRKADAESDEPASKKGRGRPRKTPVEDESNGEDAISAPERGAGRPAAPKKGRGRPKAAVKEAGEDADEEKPLPKKRGRPARKADESDAGEEANEAEQGELATAVSKSPAKKNAGKRKAPAPARAKAAKKAKTAATNEEEDETEIAGGASYWLMKAEPNTRIEKNADGEDVDVKFSIEDLRSRTQPEPWEGIRNPQAQSNLKAMKKGDLAFFYESNCKVPGIVGIMEVVEEASPDPAQFDRKSAYFDAKGNKDKPRWMLVHVEFRRKFDDKIALKDLQKFAQNDDVLSNMGLLRQTRLSVSKVAKAEWDFVMSLVEGTDVDEQVLGEEDDQMGDDSQPEQGNDKEANEDAPEQEQPAKDLGTDFARAFEAPANFAPTEEKDGHSSPEIEVPSTQDGDADTTMADAVAPLTAAIPSSETVADYAAATAAATNNGASGFLGAIGSALGLHKSKSQSRSGSRGRSGSPSLTSAGGAEAVTNAAEAVKETAGSAFESIEQVAENVAHAIAGAAEDLVPSPVLTGTKETPARAASKARSVASSVKKGAARAPSVRASSRPPSRAASVRASSRAPSIGSTSRAPSTGGRASGRAGAKARETIGSIDSAFKAQTDTIFEGMDDDNAGDSTYALGEMIAGQGDKAFSDPTSGALEGSSSTGAAHMGGGGMDDEDGFGNDNEDLDLTGAEFN